MGSSRTRARTHVPCIGRQILNHCTTREAPSNCILSEGPIAEAGEVGVAQVEVRVGDGVLLEQPLGTLDQMFSKAPGGFPGGSSG